MRITNAQRDVLMKELCSVAQVQLEKAYSKMKNLNKFFKGYGLPMISYECRNHISNISVSFPHNWQLPKVSQIANGEACGVKGDVLENKLEGIFLPREWYEKELNASNYHVESTFEDCMIKPKMRVVFDNEESALAMAKRRYRHRFNTHWKGVIEESKELYALGKDIEKVAKDMLVDVYLSSDLKDTLDTYTAKINNLV